MAVRMRKVLQTAGLVFECVTYFFRVSLRKVRSTRKEEKVRKEMKRKEKYEVLLLVDFFPARFDFVFGPTVCPWVSEDIKNSNHYQILDIN